MDAQELRYECYADFYKSEYGSAIKRLTLLPFASLLELDQTAGDWSDLPTPDLVLTNVVGGQRNYSADLGAGRFGDSLLRAHCIVVAPEARTSIQCAGRHRLQTIALPYLRLKAVVADDLRLPDDGDFGALHKGPLANPRISQMIAAIFETGDAVDPAAALFFESTLLSLAAMLVLESGKSSAVRLHRGGLADWQVRRASEALSGEYGNFDLTALAESVGLSPWHFARAFKQSTGLPPHRYQIILRIERAKDLLANTAMPLSDVAAAIGYDDQGQLARLFRREVGVTPSQYRRECTT